MHPSPRHARPRSRTYSPRHLSQAAPTGPCQKATRRSHTLVVVGCVAALAAGLVVPASAISSRSAAAFKRTAKDPRLTVRPAPVRKYGTIKAISSSSTTSTATTTTAPSVTRATAPPTTTVRASNPWAIGGSRHLYVSASGSDSNSGTASSPFRQISKAASVATAGTVVHVAPGNYGPVYSAASGTSTDRITFVSDTKWGAKITAPGQTTAWKNAGHWVTIQGFDVSGSEYNGLLTTASNGRFLGNHVHDLVPPDCSRGGAGIVAENYSAVNNDSIGNVVHDIHVSGDCARIHGIYYQSPNAGRILNNVVYRTCGWGIHLWHNANTITISNNTVFENLKGGMVIGGSLEGNDIPPGIASNVQVTNNIVVNNRHYGIREMGRVGLNVYANNLLSGNASGAYSLRGGAVPTGTVNANPQFVSATDWHLQATSPAIDKGTTLGVAPYDMDLVARPQGAAVDIGAYEG
jgi:parallel beta-helix repeat protein